MTGQQDEFILTSGERLLLRRLLDGPQADHDCIQHRVLVNCGFAERCEVGQIKITAAGRQRIDQ